MPVAPSPRFLDQVDAEYRWREREHGPESADRWYAAVDAALEELAGALFPDGYALCREADDLGEPLRQLMFGVGRTRRPSHRLIFRVTPAALEVLAVRDLRQRDLTPRDLR